MTREFTTIQARLNEIDLIRNGARSPLVAGDNAPIGSQYLGPGGMPWTKTGSTATSWAQHLLQAVYLNVKTFGAAGDGVADDRTAIRDAIDAAILLGGAVVFFPPGRYKCVVKGGGKADIPTFLLDGAARGKILFLGCGRSSLIFMSSATPLGGDRRLFDIKNGCKYVGFKSLAFQSDLVVESEQQHLIHFENSPQSTDDETGRAFIQDCYFNHTRGDAIRFLGAKGANRVKNILIERCVAQMVSATRSRTFVSFQRAVDDVTVAACYNSHVNPIDFEPTGKGSNERHRLLDNIFNGNVTLTGNGAGQEHTKSVFADNIVMGTVSGLDVENLVLSNNIIAMTFDRNAASVAFNKRIHNLVLCDNLLYRAAIATTAASVLSVANHGRVGDNHGLVISGNICLNEASTTSHPLSLLNTSKVVATDNLLLANERTHDRANGIRLQGTIEPIFNVAISGNLVMSLGRRFSAGFSGGGSNVVVTDNLFRQVNTGVTIRPKPTTDPSMAARNMLVAESGGIRLIGSTFISIDGIATDVGPSIFQVTASPEGVVVAHIGSQALRTSGGGAGTTLYIKESGDGVNTGWVGK